MLHDIAAQTDTARRREQHLAAALQHLEGAGIEGVRQINVGHLRKFFLGGVYPEVPMVADIGTERDGEGELARGLNATEGEADGAQRMVLADGDGADGEAAAGQRGSGGTGDGIGGRNTREGTARGVHHLDGHAEGVGR